MRLVSLGGIWVNPDHVVALVPSPSHEGEGEVHLSSGAHLAVTVGMDDVAERLQTPEPLAARIAECECAYCSGPIKPDDPGVRSVCRSCVDDWSNS